MSDKLTLDEALIFTLDDLSDAALDLRADPDNIDKEVIDKGQVRNEERFEAVMTSISSFIEKKNENPKVKIKPNLVFMTDIPYRQRFDYFKSK